MSMRFEPREEKYCRRVRTHHVPPVSIGTATAQFGPFDQRAWLNTAHQGPLPRSAFVAVSRASEMKAAPHRIANEEFSADGTPRSAGEVPAEGCRDIPTRNLQWNKNPR